MKFKQTALEVEAKIQEKGWGYDTSASEKIRQFKADNMGQNCTIRFEVHDGVEFFQHKYYRGYVLGAIAEIQGEVDLFYLHEFVLKENYLFFPASSYKEIPTRHAKKCRIITREEDGVRKIIGYVPSTSALNYQEFANYIKTLEDIRDGLVEWRHNIESMYYRDKAFKQEDNDERLFKEDI